MQREGGGNSGPELELEAGVEKRGRELASEQMEQVEPVGQDEQEKQDEQEEQEKRRRRQCRAQRTSSKRRTTAACPPAVASCGRDSHR